MGYELWEQLGGELPDVVLYPTGGGTGLIGMWKAWRELARARLDRARRAPAAHGLGAGRRLRAGGAGLRRRAPSAPSRSRIPRTRAWGLRVPAPLGGFLCLRALARDRRHGDRGVRGGDGSGDRARSRARSGLDICPEGGAAWAATRRAARAAAGSRPANGSWSSTPAPVSSTADASPTETAASSAP